MKRQIGLTLAVTGSLVAFAADQAHAGLVTWEFTGEVDVIFDSEGLVEGVVEIGSPFSASVTFDSTIPDVNPDNTTIGEYRDPIVGLSGLTGGVGFLFADSLSTIVVFNNGVSDNDTFALSSRPLDTSLLRGMAELSINLGDSSGTMLNSDSLSISPPAGFDSGRFQLQDVLETVVLRGDITSVVPEPMTLVLLLTGAMPLCVLRAPRRDGFVVPLLLMLAISASPSARAAAWSGGPVLIGGDDADDHFDNPPRGRVYMREGFDYLGPLVGNAKTLVVCLGCDPGDEAETNFGLAFDDSELPSLGWTRTSINGDAAINAFFANSGAVKIEDTGIIHFPSAGEVEGGLDEDEVEAINNNRAALRSFVKVDRGGLFTHAITDLPAAGGGTEPYLWLEELVPGIVVVESGGNDMYLTCTAKGAFFPRTRV